MQNKKTTGLVWFKNDLRVNDNMSLSNACKNHEKVIAVYFLDPRQSKKDDYGFIKTGKFRTKFLLETLSDLKHTLQQLNISLLVYQTTPEVKITDLIETYKISNLYCQKEWTQEELIVINSVKDKISPEVKINESYDQFLYHPEDIPIQINSIPQVFTAFRKKLEKYATIREVNKIIPKPKNNLVNNSTVIPTLSDLGFKDFTVHSNSAFPFKGGETEALKRLNNYFFETKKLGFYKKTRNGLIGTDYSSKFSSWLANGSISARTIYWKVKEFEKHNYKNESTYWLIFELIWRDYFKYISLKYGSKLFKIGGILDKNYSWSSNPKAIQKWIDGETSEPFVNANMLELKHTGWMSNRGRQNVASYFAKELELDWRIGAAYFESLLIDYDVHSNYGNWMYVAGVGNDPRDRKFNVKLQAERYDANGKFQNTWLQPTLF